MPVFSSLNDVPADDLPRLGLTFAVIVDANLPMLETKLNDPEVVQNIDILSLDGCTLLQLACAVGKVEIVQRLLAKGACAWGGDPTKRAVCLDRGGGSFMLNSLLKETQTRVTERAVQYLFGKNLLS